jgi:hypothetical protein
MTRVPEVLAASGIVIADRLPHLMAALGARSGAVPAGHVAGARRGVFPGIHQGRSAPTIDVWTFRLSDGR